MMAAMLLNERHAIHDLLQEELRTKGAIFYPALEKPDVRMALACAGAGLDHTVGEQAFVLVDDSPQGKFQIVNLVTDRRVCGRWPEKSCFDVRYHRAQSVEMKKAMLGDKLLVATGATVGPSVETVQAASNFLSLERFLRRIVNVPPEGREPPPRPLAVPTPEDPTGAKRATAWLGAHDDFATQLLAFVAGAHEFGKMPTNIAIDFVARITLHHRNVHFGRAMAEGRYLSPASMNDLSNAMVTLYGNPVGHTEQPVRTLDFDSRLRSETGKALASSALGLASAAILGVGWVSTAKRRVNRFRMMVADTGSFSSYRLQEASGRALHLLEPGLVYELDVKLLAQESELLLRRVTLGWSLDTASLLAVDIAAVDAELSSVLGSRLGGSSGVLREAVSPLLGAAQVDLEDEDNLVLRYPEDAFDSVRAQYLAHLEASGWRLVPDSETDGGKVTAMLREMGQDAAADLTEKKSVFGASFQRDDRIFSLNLESPTKGGGMLVQLSRIT